LDAPDVPNAYRKTNAGGGGNNREGNKKTNHRDISLWLYRLPELEALGQLQMNTPSRAKKGGPKAAVPC